MRASVLFVATSLLSCADPPQHVYSAQPYRADLGCLGPYEAIDLILGDRGGEAKCAPVCLTSRDGVYVSIVCGPYPEGFDVTGKSAVCQAALAAPACE